MAEGARLESVCGGNSTAGSNPALSAIFSEPLMESGPCALPLFESCQARKGAALRGIRRVPQVTWAPSGALFALSVLELTSAGTLKQKNTWRSIQDHSLHDALRAWGFGITSGRSPTLLLRQQVHRQGER